MDPLSVLAPTDGLVGGAEPGKRTDLGVADRIKRGRPSGIENDRAHTVRRDRRAERLQAQAERTHGARRTSVDVLHVEPRLLSGLDAGKQDSPSVREPLPFEV